ncbi:MAG: type II secretion system minor pseudopilin GspI [Nitrospirae bacterium]|nr:type II secretion system minor pseudopilin GspI [Nitrospirota bacterium]
MKVLRIIHNAHGFTLLEVMVALLIIATSFIVLLHSRNQSVIAADYARHMTIATLLATEKMGEMEQGRIDTTGEDSGNFGEDYPEFIWRTAISDTPYEQVREVRVEVSWGEGKGHRNVELVNYIKAVKSE